jgi:hypothetical protein
MGKDETWKHSKYGPGRELCCNLEFLDDPWDGIKAFVVPGMVDHGR